MPAALPPTQPIRLHRSVISGHSHRAKGLPFVTLPAFVPMRDTPSRGNA